MMLEEIGVVVDVCLLSARCLCLFNFFFLHVNFFVVEEVWVRWLLSSCQSRTVDYLRTATDA